MQNVIYRLTRPVLALIAIAATGLACAAYDIAIFGYPGSDMTQPSGLNNSGLVAGSLPETPGGFVYDTKKNIFTDMPALAGGLPQAIGINDLGVVVGNAFSPDGRPGHPNAPGMDIGFALQNGSYTLFSHPGFTHTFARAISTSGLVTGEAFNDDFDAGDPFAGFIYDPALSTFTDIVIPGALYITAQGINVHGYVVGSVFLDDNGAYPGSPFNVYGFVRAPSGDITLFGINSQPTKARGINDSGQITGVVDSEALGGPAAFVIALPTLGKGYQALAIPETELIFVSGATATIGQAIDNSGRVVGGWADSSGRGHGFIATPITKRKR